MKERFLKLIAGVFASFRPRIMKAPAKRGWDKIFNQPIPSQFDLMKQRDSAIKDIINEAKFFKIDLSDDVVADMDEEVYESPFQKPPAK